MNKVPRSRKFFTLAAFALLAIGSSLSVADQVNFDLSGIADGQPARAADVTNAFNAVKSAVDANDASITTNTANIGANTTRSTTNETNIADHENRITAIETAGCPADMVQVGPICVDKYEASVYDAAQAGNRIDAASPADYGCLANGSDCAAIFARSEQGLPASNITWFQAQRACANVGKRLPTNAEWQMAAAGTPDPGLGGDGVNACNTASGAKVNTGAALNCDSRFGVSDMVGNVWEWVADWIQGQAANANGNVGYGAFSDDRAQGFFAASIQENMGDVLPAALTRGGGYLDGVKAGPFAAHADLTPVYSGGQFGFRCVR